MMRRTILLLATMALTLLVASGVALAINKIGGPGPDTLRGTNEADNLLGRGGNDVLFGLAGSDNLLGEEGNDWVLGGNEENAQGGDKNLLGGPGNDGVLGGLGSDNLVGGEGRDLVDGWKGSDRMLGGGGSDWIVDDGFREFSKDVLSGGSGNDVIDAWHKPAAAEDVVTCGSGFDRVIADRADRVAAGCEKVVIVHGSLEDIFRQADRFFESIPGSFFRGLPPNPFN